MVNKIFATLLILVFLSGCGLQGLSEADFVINPSPKPIPIPAPVNPPLPPAPAPKPGKYGKLYVAQSDKEVAEYIKNYDGKNHVLFYFAQDPKRCPPCGLQTPIVMELAKAYPNTFFLKIDAMKCPQISKKYNIKATPTILYKKDRLVGLKDRQTIDKALRNKNIASTPIINELQSTTRSK